MVRKWKKKRAQTKIVNTLGKIVNENSPRICTLLETKGIERDWETTRKNVHTFRIGFNVILDRKKKSDFDLKRIDSTIY